MAMRSKLTLFPRIALILALALVTLPGLAQVRAYPEEAFGLPAAELYMADPAAQSGLTPLDARSLEDRPDRPSVQVSPGAGAPVLSADGSTFAFLDADATIVVRDGLMGPERLRISPDGEVFSLVLSRDGRRLVAELIVDDFEANLQLPLWKVYDTADGRVLVTVENAEFGHQWETSAVDPDARRLYQLASADASSEATGPQPSRLIVKDLATGAEAGRIDLPEVRGGFWQSDEVVAIGDGEEPLMKELLPALAVSPDGRRLAIAHADEDELTLIDADRFVVERTVSLTPSTSLVRRLASLLPLMPEKASAKALEGTMLQAVFAPDGKRLYLFGMISSVEEGEPVFRGLGLRAIDVATGNLSATAFGNEPIDRVVPSPDGGSLYVAGPESTERASYRLRRVDAGTLHVIAERSFPDWRWFMVHSTLVDPAVSLTVEMVEMHFVPNIVTIPANTDVQLTVTNRGMIPHSFRTGDEETRTWDLRVTLAPGETKTIVINAPPGEYKLLCAEAGHADAGMGGGIVAR